jgi:hypothetical protein
MYDILCREHEERKMFELTFIIEKYDIRPAIMAKDALQDTDLGGRPVSPEIAQFLLP